MRLTWKGVAKRRRAVATSCSSRQPFSLKSSRTGTDSSVMTCDIHATQRKQHCSQICGTCLRRWKAAVVEPCSQWKSKQWALPRFIEAEVSRYTDTTSIPTYIHSPPPPPSHACTLRHTHARQHKHAHTNTHAHTCSHAHTHKRACTNRCATWQVHFLLTG